MRQRRMPEWERKLRLMGLNLLDGIFNLFGSRDAIVYRQPTPTRRPESDRPNDAHPHPHGHANDPADRLPPRERRGRD
jgi:hypothetical protein